MPLVTLRIKLRHYWEELVRLRSAGKVVVKVSASFGVAVYPDGSFDVHSLADIADRRMFEEKRSQSEETAVAIERAETADYNE